MIPDSFFSLVGQGMTTNVSEGRPRPKFPFLPRFFLLARRGSRSALRVLEQRLELPPLGEDAVVPAGVDEQDF